jgi:hypothetical protein
MTVLVSIAVVVAVPFGVWTCFDWVLGPLERAAKGRQSAAQFNLADILCLVLLVQLSMGLSYWLTCHGSDLRENIIIDLVFIVILAATWWHYVRALSRAGVCAIRQRCIVLLLLLPVAIAGAIGVFVLPIAVLDLLWDRTHVSRDVWSLLGGVLLGCAVYVSGRVTRAIVAPAERNDRP